MNKNKLVDFARSYTAYKAMRNPEQNKVIVSSLLILITVFPSYILKIYSSMFISIILAIATLMIGFFAHKIGCIKILNNISISIFIGLAFPITAVGIFSNQIGYVFLNSLLLLLTLAIAILAGFIYTEKKIKDVSRNNEKSKKQPINNILIFLIISFALFLLKKHFLFIGLIGGYLAVIFVVPRIVASVVQFIIIKKYKLDK